MKDNIITMTDSYKISHWKMLPENTEYIYSYFEARLGAEYDYTVFVGLQGLLKKFLCGKVVTRKKIKRAKRMFKGHFGTNDMFNEDGWTYILEKYDGRLPIEIRAVEEGSVIPINNVLMTVVNTDPKCAWLTNYIETLLTWVWHSSTVATKSRNIKEVMTNAVMQSNPKAIDAVNFMLHDFGFRGAAGYEAGCAGGMGHLVNFLGTDTLGAMDYAIEYYNASKDTLAYSVPASEHSVMCAEGRDGEHRVVEKLFKEFPTGLLSIVSDTYDIEHFVTKIIGEQFRDRIINRNGKVVIRPDSPRFKGDTPEDQVVWLLELLYETFGGDMTDEGYTILPPYIGVIYGDGLSEADIKRIYKTVIGAGFCATNVVCGQGGGLLQKLNRDTQRFAFKASAIRVDGKWREVYKEPKDITKASKRGKLDLVRNKETGEYKTVSLHDSSVVAIDWTDSLLPVVYRDGELIEEIDFNKMRENAKL